MHSLVLALNPSIDVEWRLERVRWEEKNDVQSQRRWAGGKGVNVARWLQHLRGNPILLLPLGGQPGRELARYLRAEKLVARIIHLRQSTRVNVIVTTAAGRQMRFNAPGPQLSPDEWREVLQQTRRALRQSSIVILTGSLPRGVSSAAYAQLVRIAHQAGLTTVLDCDGDALTAAAPARPFLVKPNRHELAQWWGRPVHSQADLVRAALALSAVTGGWVLVSCGTQGGLLVNRNQKQLLKTRPPRVKSVNTVGAGDALVAAVARRIELGEPPREWLRWGVATGTVATQCAAGQLPKHSQILQLAATVHCSESAL